uniref:C-type lectin domain-containing protein n=1 Tax=Sinocyclocheilus grahami TaxID=75366 RepID=A0A672MC59_SINGR
MIEELELLVGQLRGVDHLYRNEGYSHCVPFFEHIFVKEIMTWQNAQKFCREHHDDLSTVNKVEALQLSSNPENKNAYFWIGLHMIFNNLENWSWSRGEDQKTDYWDIQEPNNAVEKCGCVSRHTAKLHNAMCIHYFPFYCMEVFKPILVRSRFNINIQKNLYNKKI